LSRGRGEAKKSPKDDEKQLAQRKLKGWQRISK